MECGSDLFIFSFLLTLSVTQSSQIRRFNYDARLYEQNEFDSRYVQFSRSEPDEWADLPALSASRNLSDHSMICTSGPGAWLLYPDQNYELGNSLLYYLVVGEACVRSDDIDSMQPLGKMDQLLDDGVLLFSKPQFGSKAVFVDGEEGSGEAASLIYVASSIAYQISGGSAKICLVPGMSAAMSGGYCLIPNLKASFGIEGSVTVREGCTKEADVQVVIAQHCYQPGIHEIYSDTDLSIDKLTEVCDGSGSDFLKAKFSLLIDMWGKRMGRDVEKQPLDNRADQQAKLKVIWTVFEIFKTRCNLVDDLYVYLLGQLFVMHLRNAWKTQEVNLTSVEANTLNFATGFFDYCLEMVEQEVASGPGADEMVDLTEAVCAENPQTRDPDDSYSSSWAQIANGHIFDTVIEQVWLIVNYVIPKCSGHMGYITNDWSDMVLLFNSAFFDPVQDLWLDSGDWERIYNGIFHGYDTRNEHNSLLTCLEESLKASPSYDPIGRPKSFRNVLMHKYVIPKEFEIDPSKTQRKRSISTRY